MTRVSLTLVSFFALILAALPIATNAEDTGLLWLVNRENPLCENFQPPNLVSYRGIQLRGEARDAFVKMLATMEADGIHGLRLQSAYRNYSYQQAILEEKKRSLTAKGHDPTEAAQIAIKSVQLPGASEHQLGLALDVTLDGQLSQAFAQTDAGRWLEENCHKFGFIIRYPQEKTQVTDIIYEPWHLRYVSLPHSQIMKETALTLEEYHLHLAKIPMYLTWEPESYFLVSYAISPPEFPAPQTTISATKPGKNPGFIITTQKPKPQLF